MPPYLKRYGHQIHLRNRFHVRYNWITGQGKMIMSHSAVRTRFKRSEFRTEFSESQCSDRQDQISTFTGITMYYGYNVRNQVEIKKEKLATHIITRKKDAKMHQQQLNSSQRKQKVYVKYDSRIRSRRGYIHRKFTSKCLFNC